MAVGAGRWGSYKSSGFVTIREAVVLYAYLASVAVVVLAVLCVVGALVGRKLRNMRRGHPWLESLTHSGAEVIGAPRASRYTG